MPDLQRSTEAELSEILKKQTLAETLAYNGRSNPAAGMHQPQAEHAFRGALYLLFDGVSGSSGGEVPALLHFLGVGTLIGAEPNASYQGTTAGILPTFTLPHSGIRTSVPLIAYENAVLPGIRPGRGAPPHFLVEQSLEDALRHRDTAMEFTLELIRTRRGS